MRAVDARYLENAVIRATAAQVAELRKVTAAGTPTNETGAPASTPLLASLTALVDVVLDHCPDLKVVHADATADDIQVTLASREEAFRLANRLTAAPDVTDRTRWTADLSGVRVVVRSPA